MKHRYTGKCSIGTVLTTIICLSAGCISFADDTNRGEAHPPVSKEVSDPKPSIVIRSRPRRDVPILKGSGLAAQESVNRFLAWASSSTVEEKEEGRKVIASARENKDIANALCNEIHEAQKTDHSLALEGLGVLGEMRSPVGEKCLKDFVNIPMPDKSTLTPEGENIQEIALATLQAKAVDGLAYLRTKSGDQEVFRAIQEHPSRIVRAEAINAYLWNHGDSVLARAILGKVVRKDELMFVERLRRNPGEKAESFNRRLEEYLRKHPELVPPAPQHAEKEESQAPPEW